MVSLVAITSRLHLGYNQLPIQQVLGGFLPGTEAFSSLASSAGRKNVWCTTSTSHMSSWHDVLSTFT